MEEKDVKMLSVKELEELLTKRKKEEAERLKAEREAYESLVDETTMSIVKEALGVEKHLLKFHSETTSGLTGMRDILNDYGMIRSNSKGGYHRVTKDGQYKVIYKYSTKCAWDERAEKAEGLLRDFLTDFVKKRDLKLYGIISAILERNKEGKLEYARVQSLYSREDDFDDPRWKEAIRLFREGFYPIGSKMYIEVYRRSDASQKWIPLTLNLSSI